MTKLGPNTPADHSPDPERVDDVGIPLLTTEEGRRRIEAELARLKVFVDQEKSREEGKGVAAELRIHDDTGSGLRRLLARKGSARGAI